jgi:dihydroorotate dehydrogenase (NAD+) catalytic subunit
MPAAGTFGYGDVYTDLIKTDKLGAVVTNPVTYLPWRPATGTRVISLDAGVLMHTGLPNRGLSKTLEQYRALWSGLPLPVILHLVATDLEQIRKAWPDRRRGRGRRD